MVLKGKALLASLAAAILSVLCAGLVAGVLFSGNAAYAQPNIDGFCHVKWRGEGAYDNVFSVTMPDGAVAVGHCLDEGLPAADEGDYPFSGTWNGNDYSITVDTTQGPIAPTQVDTGQGCQRVGNFTWAPKGSIELTKESSIPTLSDGNARYALSNAQYGVFQNPECTQRVATLTTDEAGHARADDLLVGTYYVQETSAPPGYAIDTAVYVVDVAMSETVQVNGGTIYDAPQSAAVTLVLQKVDAETQTAESVGGNSLEGAQISVSYYDGVFQNAAEAQASGKPTRTWALTTAADGTLSLTSESLIEGDAFYTNSLGQTCLPLGSIVLQEMSAPEGYVLDATPILVSLSSTGTKEGDVSYTAPVMANQVIRGDIEFVKAREDTQQRLSGIPFKITSLTTGEAHIIVTDENGYASSAASFNLHSLRTNANDALYEQMIEEQRETAQDEAAESESSGMDADEEALPEGAAAASAAEGEVETIAVSESTADALDASARHFVNPSGASAEGLLNDSTTDAGNASQSSSPAPSSESGTRTDASGDAESQYTTLDLRCGIWFGAMASGTMLAPKDELGALPYGRYALEELPCTANEGLELIKQSCVTINRNGHVVTQGTFDNQVAPEEDPSSPADPSPSPASQATPTPTPTSVAAVKDKTGVNLDALAACLVLIALAGCSLVAYGWQRSRKR